MEAILIVIILATGAIEETPYTTMESCEQHAEGINELGPYQARCEAMKGLGLQESSDD